MDKRQQSHRPHLFVLRVWLAEPDGDDPEWRGDIEHVASREKRYFREWQVLLDFVQRSCEQAQLQASPADEFQLHNHEKP